MKFFRKIQATDREVQALQNQVEQVLNPVLKNILLDGVIITDIDISTAGAEVEHKLNRKPLGWFLVDNTTESTIWRTGWDQRIITFDASATSVFSIWVF